MIIYPQPAPTAQPYASPDAQSQPETSHTLRYPTTTHRRIIYRLR
jgi:hypothetical protein